MCRYGRVGLLTRNNLCNEQLEPSTCFWKKRFQHLVKQGFALIPRMAHGHSIRADAHHAEPRDERAAQGRFPADEPW